MGYAILHSALWQICLFKQFCFIHPGILPLQTIVFNSLWQICLFKQFCFIHLAVLPLQTITLKFSLVNVPLQATLLTLSGKCASSSNSASFTRQFCLFKQLDLNSLWQMCLFRILCLFSQANLPLQATLKYCLFMPFCLLSQANLPLQAILLHTPGNSASFTRQFSLFEPLCVYSLWKMCLLKQLCLLSQANSPLQAIPLHTPGNSASSNNYT